jgi:hypothetical protein
MKVNNSLEEYPTGSFDPLSIDPVCLVRAKECYDASDVFCLAGSA